MKTWHLVRLFTRELKQQKKRMTLTILALAWGTFSIVILLAFARGLERQMIKATHGLGEGICMISTGQTSKPYQGLGKGRLILLQEEDVALLKSLIPEIELISPENERGANNMTYWLKSLTERVTGVSPDFEDLRGYFPQRNGRFIDAVDLAEKRRVVFLGTELKKRLFDTEDAVGKTVFINSIPFLVIGVMMDKMQNSMYSGPDVDKAAIPFSTFRAIYGDKTLQRLIYRPKDIGQSATVKDSVYRVLSEKYKFDPSDKQALDVWDMVEEEKLMKRIFAGMQIFMGIVGGLTLIVAGVGVANIMYVSAKKRTREIGIKMALGAKRRHILFQFISEALLIVFIGGASGTLLSLLIVQVFQALSLKGEVADVLAHPVLSVDIMILTVLILGAIGFLAGFFPARRAASANPVEALRYE
jgi:putative ABC transport system permease protein